jgi:hypothetical protein
MLSYFIKPVVYGRSAPDAMEPSLGRCSVGPSGQGQRRRALSGD